MRVMTSQRATATRPAAPLPGDTAADVLDRLVMEHLSLVKTLAQRLAQRLPSHVEFADLVSVGVLGLIDAATRYKPTLGVPFDAFARRRVQGAMLDSLRASLGQPILVENVGGAGGTTGTARVARAAPDGYTLSVGTWGTHVLNSFIY